MQGWNRAGAALRIPVEIVGCKIDETGSPIGFRQWVVYLHRSILHRGCI